MKSKKKHDTGKKRDAFRQELHRPFLCSALERVERSSPDRVVLSGVLDSGMGAGVRPVRTASKMSALVRGVANFLDAHGVGQNDVVAVDAPMRWEVPVIWVSAQSLGARVLFFPTDRRLRQAQGDVDVLEKAGARVCVFVEDPLDASFWRGSGRVVVYLDVETPDGRRADDVLGWPVPEDVCSFTRAVETLGEVERQVRVGDESVAAMVYSQGAHQGVRQISLSYAQLSSQAEELASLMSLDVTSRVFVDMASVQTVGLFVFAACLWVGCEFVCGVGRGGWMGGMEQVRPTHVFLRPGECVRCLDAIRRAPHGRLSQSRRMLELSLIKFRDRNTRAWLRWASPVIARACIRPLRERYFPGVRMVVMYGNRFEPKAAEILSFLDLDVVNAFVMSEFGVVHWHRYKGEGGFLRNLEARIRGGVLSVRARRASQAFVDSGDWVFEDAQCGLCAARTQGVTLASGETVDTLPMCDILRRHALIDDVFVFGAGRTYLTALVYLAPEALRDFARAHRLPSDASFEVLAQNPGVYEAVRALVDAGNAMRRPAESIRKIAVLTVPLEADPRILTPCGLARYGEIERRYASLIEGFYRENF